MVSEVDLETRIKEEQIALILSFLCYLPPLPFLSCAFCLRRELSSALEDEAGRLRKPNDVATPRLGLPLPLPPALFSRFFAPFDSE